MKTKFSSNLLEYRLGDVRDRETMISCFKGVDYIFHAAALKHVLCANFFIEVKNKYIWYRKCSQS